MNRSLNLLLSSILTLVAALPAMGASPAPDASLRPSQPNIIILFADDLGYGDLSCYGSTKNASPRLDRMAQEGIRFTDFYAAQPVCTPSRAGLMSGCYPIRVGLEKGVDAGAGVLFPGDAIGLDPARPTLPRVMKNAGYRTMAIGKWHLGDQPEFMPLSHGFDHFFGLPYSNDMDPYGSSGQRRRHPPLPLMQDDKILETDPNQATLTDRFTAEAVRFIRDSAKNEEPFFLYFAHIYVHGPLHTPIKFQMSSKNDTYGAAVAHLDYTTGFLLDELARLGIDDNTLAIFTSDNGSDIRSGHGSNAPLRGAKGSTWEGGPRVPCIMRWPGHIPASSTCSEVSSTMDFLPTLAEFAGAQLPGDSPIDGKDIAPLLLGEPGATSPHEAFFYYGTRDSTLHAVRSGKWKLHLIRNELYDLETDIGEQNNVAAANPDIVARLTTLANQCREELGDAHTGTQGTGRRPPGRVENPQPLTTFDIMDPIIRAMYDLEETP